MVKFQGNPIGLRALAGEFVCNQLLHELQFSSLSGRLVEVSAFFIATEPNLKDRNLRAGLQYASPYVEDHDDYNAGYVPQLTNRDALPEVIAFDTFICNRDRSPGNVLISFADPSRNNRSCTFHLVDHSEAFGTGRWSEETLKSLQNDENIYVYAVTFDHISPKMDAFESSLVRLEALTPAKIKEIIEGVPSEWKLFIGEATALEEFLIDRKAKVRAILAKHLKPTHA